MKKIINGKLYDTTTAKELAVWSNTADWGDFSRCSETLFRKKTGEFFLHGEGGPASKYAQAVSTNSWRSGERIMPLSWQEARQWAEEHLGADDYQEIFGAIAEDDSRQVVTYSLSAAAAETARRRAGELGISVSAYIERLITN